MISLLDSVDRFTRRVFYVKKVSSDYSLSETEVRRYFNELERRGLVVSPSKNIYLFTKPRLTDGEVDTMCEIADQMGLSSDQ